MCVCVCVCESVWVLVRLYKYVWVCVCVREREIDGGRRVAVICAYGNQAVSVHVYNLLSTNRVMLLRTDT